MSNSKKINKNPTQSKVETMMMKPGNGSKQIYAINQASCNQFASVWYNDVLNTITKGF